MFKETLSSHYTELTRQFGIGGNVFVYKGFPLSLYQEISQKYQPLTQINIFDSEGRISLDSIEQNVKAYTKAILAVDESKNYCLLYEEFLSFTKHVSPSLAEIRFVIVTNNLYKLYPNQSNHTVPDLETIIDSNNPITNDDDVYDHFYSNSVVIDHKHYLQYIDVDIDSWTNVVRYKYFQRDDLPKLETLPYQEKEETNLNELIRFQPNDPQYLHLKYQLFFGNPDSNISILVDENSIKFHEEELRILQFLFSNASQAYVFFYRKDTYENKCREELKNIFAEYWAGASFRDLNFYKDPDISRELVQLSQGAICEHIVKQTELASQAKVYEDIFLTAPTGAGKSVLFQVPAIYLADKYGLVTIVISPLKALMQDQVSSLKEDRNYHNVACINSDLSLVERDQIINEIKGGNISIVYVSPELLQSYDITHFIGDRKIGLMVIDEAHLVTTWGRDFRVDYWFLGNYIRKIRRNSKNTKGAAYQSKHMLFPVLAVTATAVFGGPNDMVFDTIGSINMQNCSKFIGYVRRDNISFNIRPFVLPTNSHEKDKVVKTAQVIQDFLKKGTKAIIYFPWISTIKDVLKQLSPAEQVAVGCYYSWVEIDERHRVLREFKSGDIKVVLATKAFGMGVDISDIQEVYHHAPSGTVADYVQEIGRVARLKHMTGVASTDFHKTDLKFSKILFGLSSLKQYQVKLVLEKLHNIYKLNKRRNFLVSVDDFAHIFPSEKDPEQKIKSALLVLEKDMLARYDYNAIIVRPKSIFSTVYARVDNGDREKFIEKYGAYVKEEKITTRSVAPRTINSITSSTPAQQVKTSIFKIELDKLWENEFVDESFPTIKYKFFKKELFNDVAEVRPQLKLSVEFNQQVPETLTLLTNNFEKLEKAINKFTGGYFSKKDLAGELNKEFNNETMVTNATNLLLALYTEINTFGKNGGQQATGHFIQKRFNPSSKMEEYRVLNAAFTKVKHQSRSKFQAMFSGIESGVLFYNNFISANPEKNAEIVKLVYIMELFGLCTFKLSGGEQPQIFIRINDPLKVERLAKSRYSNATITEVERKHKMNIGIMEHFFTSKLNDQERWTFIENYFLGKDIDSETDETDLDMID